MTYPKHSYSLRGVTLHTEFLKDTPTITSSYRNRINSIYKPFAHLTWNTYIRRHENSEKDLNTSNTLFWKCICLVCTTYELLSIVRNQKIIYSHCTKRILLHRIFVWWHTITFIQIQPIEINSQTNSILDSCTVQWELNGSQYCDRNINWCENMCIPSIHFNEHNRNW